MNPVVRIYSNGLFNLSRHRDFEDNFRLKFCCFVKHRRNFISATIYIKLKCFVTQVL